MRGTMKIVLLSVASGERRGHAVPRGGVFPRPTVGSVSVGARQLERCQEKPGRPSATCSVPRLCLSIYICIYIYIYVLRVYDIRDLYKYI
jgi:hypothetical protein